MSRIARIPVLIPKGVTVTLAHDQCEVKGPKGVLSLPVHKQVNLLVEADKVSFSASGQSIAERTSLGTMRSHVNNMIVGVTTGFQRKLDLVGVGYRAKVAGSILNLSVGYSHPVAYTLPAGVTAETPTQTEIVLKSHDKQLLGQVSSEIRAFRPPEPYKGKGIKYSDEKVVRKEAKKK